MSLSQLQNSILETLKKASLNNALFFKSSFDTEFGYHKVSLATRINGYDYVGFGAAKTKDQAALCATMELCERLVFNLADFETGSLKQQKLFLKKSLSRTDFENLNSCFNLYYKTTSGLAIHTDRTAAIENAADELIERHVILKSMALQIPPLKDQSSEYCELYFWQGPIDRYIYLARKKVESKVIFGFGSSTDQNLAKEKSIREISQKLDVLNSHTLDSVKELSLPENAIFHFTKKSWTESWLNRESSVAAACVDTHLKKECLWVQAVGLPSILSQFSSDLFAVKVISQEMQPFFVGEWDLAKINSVAIKSKNFPPEMHMVG